MNHFAVMDDPVAISKILDTQQLTEILESFAGLHNVSVSLADMQGRVLCEGLCGQELSASTLFSLEYGGESVGRIRVATSDAHSSDSVEAMGAFLQKTLGMLVESSYAKFLSTQLSETALEESFSELRQSNTRLSSALRCLDELEGLKSNFLATVSHELRTPLTSIIGYSEMLSEGLAGSLSEEQAEFVHTILSKSDQLLQLITGILDVSQIEANSLRLHCKPVDLGAIIESVARTLQFDLEHRKIVLELPTEAVPKALVDEVKLKQVIVHLLANAIKFSPQGGDVRVTVAVGTLAQEDDSIAESPFWSDCLSKRFGLRVTVMDQGIGIPLEKRRLIFEPFFQVDSGSTRAYGGPGLGLSLAQSYVTAHGGFLWIDSPEDGVGSAFTFTVPADPAELKAYVSTTKGKGL